MWSCSLPIGKYAIERNKCPPIRGEYEECDVLIFGLLGSIFERYFVTEMTRFIINQPVSVEENRYYEFKEITGKNPVNTIKNTCDEYVVAFLNSDSGRIYWGIRDKDRVVVGVKLTYQDRDKLRRTITSQLSNIEPAISPSAYQVKFHQILDENQVPLNDYFVVEVVVPKSLSKKVLYATGSGDFFIKTDSGKKKLSPAEINDEILRRNQISESYVRPVQQRLDGSNKDDRFLLQLRYAENGVLLYEDSELDAIANETVWAVESGVGIDVAIEFTEIEEIEDFLEKLKDKNLTSQERILRIEILKHLKFLEEQKRKLEQALDVIVSDPVFSYCRDYRYIAYVFRGLGKRLLGKTLWNNNDIFVPLDLWYREDEKIHTVSVIELDSKDERKLYTNLIGNGWDLYDLPKKAMFEYAVPAIVLEYLCLKNEGNFEDIGKILDLVMWNVGLR